MADNGLGYDEDELKKDLWTWWQEEGGGGEDDPFGKPKRPPGTIFDVVPAIDSLAAVTALVTVEKHVGFELPQKSVGRLIKRGGYSSFEDMVSDLMPKLRAVVEQQKAPGTARKEKTNERSTTRARLSVAAIEGHRSSGAWHSAKGSA